MTPVEVLDELERLYGDYAGAGGPLQVCDANERLLVQLREHAESLLADSRALHAVAENIQKDLQRIVRLLIGMFREHWVKTGTAIRDEDAEVVTRDLLMRHPELLAIIEGNPQT